MSIRLIHTASNVLNDKIAKVYRDAEWNEYRVKHMLHGKHEVSADYHTDDKNEALNWANKWVNFSAAKLLGV